jgi:hypothetical protein
MKQFGARVNGKQLKYNTPIKFKSTQDASHAPQDKAKVVQAKQVKKPKSYASQDITKYVGTYTKGTLIKRNV